MMSCSATAISSSSNFGSGLSTAFAAFTGFGVAAGFTTRAMSASPFQIRDGAGKLSGLSFQPSHPLRVATPLGLGKLADYPTVHTLHALQADSLGEFNCHFVIDVRRRCRPSSSDQVLLLGRISGHLGPEPRRPAALVASQHTDENATFAFVEVLGGKHRLHLLESHRPDGQQLYEIFGGGRRPGPSPPRGRGWGEGRGRSTCGDGKKMRLDPDPPRRPLSIRLPHRRVRDPVEHFSRPRRRQLEMVRVARVQPAERVPDPGLPPRRGGRHELLPALRRLGPGRAKELVRILGWSRDRGHARPYLMRGRKLDGLERGRAPGAIGVEHQQQLVREPLQQPHLVLGQSRARAGHGVGNAELVGGDHVELPLHQHGEAALGDLVPRQVEAEDHASFYVGRRFGRVDVLPLLVRPDGPGCERQHLAALVPDRDDQSLSEEVGPVPPHQPGLQSVGKRALLGPQVLGDAPTRRGVAELNPPGGLLADAARLEQLPALFAGRALPQHVLVVLGSELEHVEDPVPGVGPLPLLRAELLQLHSRSLRQHLQRATLIGLLDELDEREDVARPLASEAVPGLHLGVDLEARAVLLVEGAQAPEVAVALGQADALRHDLDQVDLGLDLRTGAIGRKGGHVNILPLLTFPNFPLPAGERVRVRGERRSILQRAMATVPTVLELILLIPLAVLGAIVLATGRRVPPGIPPGLAEGRSLRLYGLLYLAVGGGVSWIVWRNGASWDAVVIAYFFLVVAIVPAVQRSRKANSPRG